MKAPFLTIGGKPVQKGTLYCTVRLSDLQKNFHAAADENNTADFVYFLLEEKADIYISYVKLYRLLKENIETVENEFKGK